MCDPSVCRRPAAALVVTLMLFSVRARAEDESKDEKPAAASTTGKGGPKLAGTKVEKAEDVEVVSTQEDEGGVKTYEFGAVEVEGRLRSPQIIYFLRRVRAQFAARGLGHRSFLRELSDTRRHAAFK